MLQDYGSKKTLHKIFNDEQKVNGYVVSLQLIAKSLEVIDKLGGNKEGVRHLLRGLEILSSELGAVSNQITNKITIEDLLGKLLGKK